MTDRLHLCDPKHGLYDSSALADFQRCPLFYYLKHEGEMPMEESGVALEYGTLLHQALATWYRSHDPDAVLGGIEAYPWDRFEQDEKHTREGALTSLKRYMAHFVTEPWEEVLAIEEPFQVLMCEEGDVRLGGQFDLVVRWAGHIVVVDHKSTTWFGASYFGQFRPHLQMDDYALACRAKYGECAGVLINVIPVKAGGARDKDFLYSRDRTPRTDAEMARAKRDFVDNVRCIECCRASGQWPRATSHCHEFFRTCMFGERCMLGES